MPLHNTSGTPVPCAHVHPDLLAEHRHQAFHGVLTAAAAVMGTKL